LLSTVLVVAGGALMSALLLPFMSAPAPASWPFIAASSLTQTVYYLLLIEAYRSGDMSHAYPLMRGSAPLLVALVNGILTGERLSPAAVAGRLPDLRRRAGDAAGRAHAFGQAARQPAPRHHVRTGDRLRDRAVHDHRRRRRAPLGCAGRLHDVDLPADGTAVLAWTARGRIRALAALARARPLVLPIGGVSTLGSYGIALWAMTLAPVAAIAALRETSILFATAIAALVLRERVGRGALLAVGLIACGAVAMRLA
jgi:uncharacterized membrane protein